ncbi:hypothetical protein [Mesorhizobium prunaredense]|nr:hypothetical protein [Mesorhizobium prunaredense]
MISIDLVEHQAGTREELHMAVEIDYLEESPVGIVRGALDTLTLLAMSF